MIPSFELIQFETTDNIVSIDKREPQATETSL